MHASIADALGRVSLILPPTHPAVLVVLKITLLLVIALAATEGLTRASAGARHLVWLVALAGLLAVPVVNRWGPLRVPVLPPAETASLEHTAPSPQAVAPTPLPATPSSIGDLDRDTGATPFAEEAVGIGAILLLLWAVVAFALTGRIALSAWAVRRVVRGARPLDDPAWQAPLYEIADRLGLASAPRLVQSDEARMPFAAGFANSVIVLPKDSEGWSAERRSAVLIHELGHVRRRDLIGHTLSRVACALYWFHPLVWTAARRLRAESERACDDLALAFGARPSDYAEHLLDIVTCVRDHRTPAIALAMAHRKEFEGRMLAILNPDLSRRGPTRVETATVVVALMGLALLVGAAAPVRRAAAAPTSSAGNQPSLEIVTADSGTDRSSLAEDTAALPLMTHVPTQAAAPTPTPGPTVGSSRTVRLDSPAQDPEDRAAALAKALRSDSSARVRRTAAWGLNRYNHLAVASDALAAAVANDKDPEVREMAAWALAGAPRDSKVQTTLATALQRDGDGEVRTTAAWALTEIGGAAAAEALVAALRDGDAAVRETAAWGVGSLGRGTAPAGLTALLDDQDPKVRLATAWALNGFADPATAPAIEAAFGRESEREVQLGLIRALGAMGDLALATLEKLITSPDDEIRTMAVTALAGGQVSGPWPWPRPRPRPFP